MFAVLTCNAVENKVHDVLAKNKEKSQRLIQLRKTPLSESGKMSRIGRNIAVPSAHHSCCRLVAVCQFPSPAGDGWAGPTRTTHFPQGIGVLDCENPSSH